jgi:hypothetical protein
MLCVKIYQYGQNDKIQLKMQKEIEKFIAYLKVERHYALNTQQAYEKDLRQFWLTLGVCKPKAQLLGMIFWDNK